MKSNVYKKRKTTQTTKKPTKNYIKKDKLNRWAPKISLKEYKYFDNPIVNVSVATATVGANVDWLNQTTVEYPHTRYLNSYRSTNNTSSSKYHKNGAHL